MTGIQKIMTYEPPLGVTNTMQTRAASWLLAQMHTASCHMKCCVMIDVASLSCMQYRMVTKESDAITFTIHRYDFHYR